MDLKISNFNNKNKVINLDTILKKFNNKKLKKIVNVYQLQYINHKSPGIGDFLRGSFCFIQVARLLNLEFEIDISNHPISKYIKNSSNINNINYNNILFYMEVNRNPKLTDYDYEKSITNLNIDFLENTIQWFNSQNCEIFYFFSNAFPCFNQFTQIDKNIINLKLQPNEFMEKYIDTTLNELKLSKKGYGIIHIRAGDEYISGIKTIDKIFLDKIKGIINKIIIPERRYLIISDSCQLKEYLKIYQNFYISKKNIEHLGGEAININNTEGIMNTMLEYYLMSYSNAIISMSVYQHISGFSKYCGVLNNIPCKFIKIN
jgi:hypothetical protein